MESKNENKLNKTHSQIEETGGCLRGGLEEGEIREGN